VQIVTGDSDYARGPMDSVREPEPRIRLDLPRSGLLVLVGPAVRQPPSHLVELDEGAPVHRLTDRVPRRQDSEAVLLVVHDLVDLRLAATGIGQVGTASTVAVVFERETPRLPAVVCQPGWPALEEARVLRGPRPHVLLRFADPVPARSVVLHLARSSAASGTSSSTWPVLGVRRDEPGRWPPNDPAAVVAGPKRLFGAAGDFPPDLVIAEDAPAPDSLDLDPHPVLGRVPVVVRAEADLSWAELVSLQEAQGREALARRGPLSLGPVDEMLFNPMGFDREPVGRAVPLRARSDGALVAGRGSDTELVVADGHGRVSDSDLPALRRLPGLDVDWSGGAGPQAYCRALVRLACAGVPLVAAITPDWARELLSAPLLAALQEEPDLTDPLRREEHSVRVRRAALAHHATSAWRRSLAGAAGAQQSPPESVSVLLATRRPEMLPFALRQVARQRGVPFELVLATHGFAPDPPTVQEFSEVCGAPVTVVEVDTDVRFGEVLNRAAAHAQGAVLAKMDDDDWYGPDFLHELVLARSYSGAGLVGALPEITYLEPLGVTTRRAGPTELYSFFVAGGTLLVDVGAWRSVGGFRDTRKYVDAALLRGLSSAGVSIYRTHGLGYVLRRGDHGHTWDPGMDYFLHPDRAAHQWEGFRPSTLIEARPEDLPGVAPRRHGTATS
jgi:hypothetical protein